MRLRSLVLGLLASLVPGLLLQARQASANCQLVRGWTAARGLSPPSDQASQCDTAAGCAAAEQAPTSIAASPSTKPYRHPCGWGGRKGGRTTCLWLPATSACPQEFHLDGIDIELFGRIVREQGIEELRVKSLQITRVAEQLWQPRRCCWHPLGCLLEPELRAVEHPLASFRRKS